MTSARTLPQAKIRPADRIFAGSTKAAGALILLALASVAVFLIAESIPALVANPEDLKGDYPNFWAYVGPLVFGTLWAAFLALLIAFPISIGIALFISHYAPRPIAQLLGYIIDLLAAVP
jgi:phosphate transport system permease protein